MKRGLLFIGILSFLLVTPCVHAQAVDENICDILANPQSFDGKIVRIKGVVIAGFEEFAIKGEGCNQQVNSIWLAYPEGTKGKAGPAALLRLQLAKNNPAAVTSANRTAIKLDKNKDFKDFEGFLSTPAKAGDICLGCMKFTVSATLVGRLDGTKETGLIRDSGGKAIAVGGFGNLNRYNARLVLQSVSDISSQEINYEKGGSAALDMISANRVFTPTQPNGDLVKRGAEAFGAPGVDNGVVVGFGVANEIPKDDGNKSPTNSPDGVTYYVMGVPQLIAMGISGHETANMFKRYAITLEDEQRDALAAVAAYHEKKIKQAAVRREGVVSISA